MKPLAIILIVLGLVGLGVGAFSYKTTEKVVDLGPIEVNKENSHTIPIPTVASVVVLVAGALLLFSGKRVGS